MDQPGKVANPARGQLNSENEYLPVRVRSRLRIWSRETGSTVPSRVSLLIFIPRLNLVLTYGPEFRGGVHLFFCIPDVSFEADEWAVTRHRLNFARSRAASDGCA